MKNQIQIRTLIKEDIAIISDAFNQIGWNKPESLFIYSYKIYSSIFD
jgi:hypothetical protein